MKKTYILTLLVALLIGSLFAQPSSIGRKKIFTPSAPSQRSVVVFNYTLTTLSDTYSDLTGATSINNGEVWDEPTYTVPLGFPFQLNGHDIIDLTFYGSGSITFSNTNDPNIQTFLIPFETDLIDRGANGFTSLSPISYKVEGMAGSRIQKIEFKNAGSYYEMDAFGTLDMYINFQVWLFEGSNMVEFHFGPNLVNDPDTFYGGDPGAFSGISDYDVSVDLPLNQNFVAGPVADPSLTDAEATLEGTPADGIIYRLTFNLPLAVDVVGENSTSSCAPNGSATANVTGGIEPYTYAWSNGLGTSTIQNLDAGTYSVTVTDAAASSVTGNVSITNAAPLVANASSTDETAIGANDGTASATPFGGLPPYTFAWSNGETTSAITGLTPGVYSVTVTDAAGCTDAQSVTVNASVCPDILIEAVVSNVNCFGVCDGSIGILQITNAAPPIAFIWSNGSNQSDQQGLCAGIYTLTITDANGCTALGDYEITEPPLLVVFTGSTDETSADGNDGTAWATPSGGTLPYGYAWSNGGLDSLITGLAPGLYSVTVTDANLCSDTQTVEVDSFGCILSAIVLNSTCFGNCNGSIEVSLNNAIPPVTYLWSNGMTTATISGLCAGGYSVTAADGAGCVATGSYTVTEPAELLANAVGTDETTPGANDGSVWAAPTGGTQPYSYSWNNGSTDSLLINLGPDIYTVIVTDANACQDTQSVIVHPGHCIGIIETALLNLSCFGICDGEAAVGVTGGIGPLSFEWNTGDTTSFITNLCAGTYEVTITDEGENCSSVQSFEISQPDPLWIAIDSVIHVTDTTSGSIFISTIGGIPPYTFFWTGPLGFTSSTEDIAEINPGFYKITVDDVNGCFTYIDSIEIVDNSTVSISDPNTFTARVYPNPAKGQVFIDASERMDYEIQLFSNTGQNLETWKNVEKLDVSRFTSGVYLMRFTSGKESFVLRLLITK